MILNRFKSVTLRVILVSLCFVHLSFKIYGFHESKLIIVYYMIVSKTISCCQKTILQLRNFCLIKIYRYRHFSKKKFSQDFQVFYSEVGRNISSGYTKNFQTIYVFIKPLIIHFILYSSMFIIFC